MKYLFHIAKKTLLITTLLASTIVAAQHHHMSSIPKKNTFLEMMDDMMVKMEAASIMKSAELDFILQMIPHHEGAIEMANYEITNGKKPEMIQLAKSILAEQTHEVQLMKLWLKQSLETTIVKTSDDFQLSMNKTMEVMMQNTPENHTLTDTDQAFASVMLPHHQGAVNMAKGVIKFSKDPQTIAFANHLISSEQIEIEQMFAFLNK
jgi:uncharacterized protein (DUF305 family)